MSKIKTLYENISSNISLLTQQHESLPNTNEYQEQILIQISSYINRKKSKLQKKLSTFLQTRSSNIDKMYEIEDSISSLKSNIRSLDLAQEINSQEAELEDTIRALQARMSEKDFTFYEFEGHETIIHQSERNFFDNYDNFQENLQQFQRFIGELSVDEFHDFQEINTLENELQEIEFEIQYLDNKITKFNSNSNREKDNQVLQHALLGKNKLEEKKHLMEQRIEELANDKYHLYSQYIDQLKSDVFLYHAENISFLSIEDIDNMVKSIHDYVMSKNSRKFEVKANRHLSEDKQPPSLFEEYYTNGFITRTLPNKQNERLAKLFRDSLLKRAEYDFLSPEDSSKLIEIHSKLISSNKLQEILYNLIDPNAVQTELSNEDLDTILKEAGLYEQEGGFFNRKNRNKNIETKKILQRQIEWFKTNYLEHPEIFTIRSNIATLQNLQQQTNEHRRSKGSYESLVKIYKTMLSQKETLDSMQQTLENHQRELSSYEKQIEQLKSDNSSISEKMSELEKQKKAIPTIGEIHEFVLSGDNIPDSDKIEEFLESKEFKKVQKILTEEREEVERQTPIIQSQQKEFINLKAQLLSQIEEFNKFIKEIDNKEFLKNIADIEKNINLMQEQFDKIIGFFQGTEIDHLNKLTNVFVEREKEAYQNVQNYLFGHFEENKYIEGIDVNINQWIDEEINKGRNSISATELKDKMESILDNMIKRDLILENNKETILKNIENFVRTKYENSSNNEEAEADLDSYEIKIYEVKNVFMRLLDHIVDNIKFYTNINYKTKNDEINESKVQIRNFILSEIDEENEINFYKQPEFLDTQTNKLRKIKREMLSNNLLDKITDIRGDVSRYISENQSSNSRITNLPNKQRGRDSSIAKK